MPDTPQPSTTTVTHQPLAAERKRATMVLGSTARAPANRNRPVASEGLSASVVSPAAADAPNIMAATDQNQRAMRPSQSGSAAVDSRTPVVPVVHVVDDEATVRTLFMNMARIMPYEFRTHGSAGEFFADFDEDRPGCLVLDLHLPDRSGIEVLHDLAERQSQVPVVFMSGMASVGEAVKAIKLGSLDFVEKPFDLQVMVDAIHQAIGKDQERRTADAASDSLRKRFDRLTQREREVLELVVGGAANKDVANALGLSPKTVEVHRANVMRKTQAGSLAELVRLYVAVKGEGYGEDG